MAEMAETTKPDPKECVAKIMRLRDSIAEAIVRIIGNGKATGRLGIHLNELEGVVHRHEPAEVVARTADGLVSAAVRVASVAELLPDDAVAREVVQSLNAIAGEARTL